MAGRFTSPERGLVALLAAIAAAAFFFPLLSVHVPIAGDEQVTGYEAASKIRQLTDQVRSLTGHGEENKPSANAPRLPRLPSGGPASASTAPSKLPISIRLSWLIPVFIVMAFGCALLTLLGSLTSLILTRIASAAGAVAGFVALVHLAVMDSAIRQALQEAIQRSTGGSKVGFVASFAQAVGSALVDAFDLRAGVALYALTVALGLAAALAWSRLLARPRSSPPVS